MSRSTPEPQGALGNSITPGLPRLLRVTDPPPSEVGAAPCDFTAFHGIG